MLEIIMSKKPDTRDLKSLTVWLDPELPRQLKMLAAEQETQVRTLVIEFLNDGLVKYGKARVE